MAATLIDMLARLDPLKIFNGGVTGLVTAGLLCGMPEA